MNRDINSVSFLELNGRTGEGTIRGDGSEKIDKNRQMSMATERLGTRKEHTIADIHREQ
jgi:hypothetical protein